MKEGVTIMTVASEDPIDEQVKTAFEEPAATEDTSVDWVMTLGAPIALNAVQAIEAAGSDAQIGTFDTSAELVGAIQDGDVAFAIDQQPYLQGYLAVDSIWLYINNLNTIGGGQNTPTGPSFVDSSNVDAVAEFAANGTR